MIIEASSIFRNVFRLHGNENHAFSNSRLWFEELSFLDGLVWTERQTGVEI